MADSPLTSVEQLPTAVVVRVLAKELNKDAVDALCAAIDHARIAAPALPYIVDLTIATFAGSMALGVLVGLNQEFRNRQQRLIFVNLQKSVREVVEISRIKRVLEIMQDVPTALSNIAAAG